MWKLLTGNLARGFTGILPNAYDFKEQNLLPSDHGVGIASIAMLPGNDASKLTTQVMKSWIPHFYGRLRSHVMRVRLAEGCEDYQGPSIVAFEGKRHFNLLFEEQVKSLQYGPLPSSFKLPSGWPYPRDSCQIWILPSASGRAAMTHAERIGPYENLALELSTKRTWKRRTNTCQCKQNSQKNNE